MRRGAAVLAGLVLLAGCSTASSQPSVPQVTVGGSSDPQTSLAPGQVLGARRAAGIADCPASTAAPVTGGQALPDLTLECLGGDSSVTLSKLPTGRPRLINVWAQWCGPCTSEAPYLAEVSKQLAGKVDFLGIDYQDPQPGKAIDFAKHYGLTYPELVDVQTASRVPLRIGAIPQTILVDAQGHVVFRQTVQLTSADQLRQVIADHLGVRS